MENEKIIEQKKKIYEKWWFWILLIFIVIVCIGMRMSESDSKNIGESTNKNTITTNTKPIINKIEVEVVDFSSMERVDIESWCNTNKIKLNITQEYSNNIEKSLFVRQSVQPNNTIYQGDSITVVYSLGKEPTLGEKNALESAKDYIKTMPFSYTGLIKQLKYEGYSNEEATYGADNCGADWNEQAAKSAKNYINTMSFSRSGLIKQLKYEGFTNEQAQYGVASVGY